MRLCPKAVGALRMARDEGTPERRAPWPRIAAVGLLRRPPALREIGNPAGHGLPLGDPEKEACGAIPSAVFAQTRSGTLPLLP